MTLGAAAVVASLKSGTTSSEALTRDCLDRIADPAGEGARVFTAVLADAALAAARASDARRARGELLGPLDGIPVSVKCLFDLTGLITHSGSRLLADGAPATTDAAAIARLRAAGAVILGHTNMTEFAYSGLGMNPHYGTPPNPAARDRVPGGSSSGAAVGVGDGMAVIGIGSDTGGSCRIPAAFCGLTGFKPTARRIPAAGAFPLSTTLDSFGSIAADVFGVALADAVMANEAEVSLPPVPTLAGMRFGALETYVLSGIAPEVARAYDAALERLRAAGATVESVTLPVIEEIPALNAQGGITGAEALAAHAGWLATREEEYDPRVAIRIRKAEAQAPGERDRLIAARERMAAEAAPVLARYDAILMPTVPLLAPVTADLLHDDDAYGAANLLALRNPTVANFLDACALSLPLPVDGLPVGITLMGAPMTDRRLLSIGTAVEAKLTLSRGTE